ncbi:conserved uncharacterized protein, DUF354 [Desulfosarcina variabilis str. Montpellier]|uniref:DUF354 domain-containing protein n=1 Tax=Desulfosarcina variabilis TaxID=2300 RepID=UPI003AFA7E8E
MKKKIWIDLDNSPHVLFFYPLIKELEKKGYSLLITARDYAQVTGLVKLFEINASIIGKHYGKKKLIKIIGFFFRSVQLLIAIHKEHPDIAFSHFSRSQILAAKLLKIPTIAAYDYEFVQKLIFINPNLCLVPEVLYKNGGLSRNKNYKSYPGLKENVYMQNVEYIDTIKNVLDINEKDIVITIRPPATEAHYHRSYSSKLFDLIMSYLVTKEHTKLILLPRTKKQKVSIKLKWKEYILKRKILIPDEVINGVEIVNISDIVISGGGTMIREAAAINVPAYSFFGGKTGEVDKYLEKMGKLTIIRKPIDIKKKIKILKHKKLKSYKNDLNLTISSIIGYVDNLIQ